MPMGFLSLHARRIQQHASYFRAWREDLHLLLLQVLAFSIAGTGRCLGSGGTLSQNNRAWEPLQLKETVDKGRPSTENSGKSPMSIPDREWAPGAAQRKF